MGTHFSTLLDTVDLEEYQREVGSLIKNQPNVQENEIRFGRIDARLSNVIACSCNLSYNANVKIKETTEIPDVFEIAPQFVEDTYVYLTENTDFTDKLKEISGTDELYQQNLALIKENLGPNVEEVENVLTTIESETDIDLKTSVMAENNLSIDGIFMDPCGFNYFLPEGQKCSDSVMDLKDKVPESVWNNCVDENDNLPVCNVNTNVTIEDTTKILVNGVLERLQEIELKVPEPDDDPPDDDPPDEQWWEKIPWWGWVISGLGPFVVSIGIISENPYVSFICIIIGIIMFLSPLFFMFS